MAGGGIDAYRTRNTTFLPSKPPVSIPEETPVSVSADELKRPGILYSLLIGGFAALLSWALYGPLAQINLLDLSAAGRDYAIAMTLAAVGGAVFVGMGGAR